MGFDNKKDSSVRIGARVAVALGLVSGCLSDLLDMNTKCLNLSNVISHILKLRLETNQQSVYAIIIHLDEFQLYIDDVRIHQKTSWELACKFFKTMLKEIGSVMCENSNANYFIVPICTGTSAIDINFLPTEYPQRSLNLKPLNYESARSMFLDKYEYLRQATDKGRELVTQSLNKYYSSNNLNDESIESLSTKFCNFVLKQNHFCIAIYDTGFIPKFIDDLLSPSVLTSDFDWGNQLFNKISKRTIAKIGNNPGNWKSLDDIRTIISFGLTRQSIKRDFLLPSSMTIGELERAGLIYLSNFKGEQHTIVMPFILLKILNNILLTSNVETVFPDNLLLIPTYDVPWQWQDFKNLYGYYQKAIIDSLIEVKNSIILSIKHKIYHLEVEDKNQTDSYEKSKINAEIKRITNDLAIQTNKNWQLSDIFPGAKGASTLLQRKVQLRKLKVFTENEKFPVKTSDIAKFTKFVLCDDNVSREFDRGIFRCYQRCANINHRWILDSADEEKKLAIFSQIKYSERDATTTISTPVIKRWYDTTMASVENYKTEYDVILVLFTNWTCIGTIDMEQMPKLLLIYPDNMELYLSPAFTYRSLVDRPSEN
ncbi:hypothetical protein C1646_687708, partial [Rhizophagus diaphanus]